MATTGSNDERHRELTNEEDFQQVDAASVVNIISTPWHVPNPRQGGSKPATFSVPLLLCWRGRFETASQRFLVAGTSTFSLKVLQSNFESHVCWAASRACCKHVCG